MSIIKTISYPRLLIMTTALFFQSFGTGYTAEPKTFSENPMIGKIGENPVLLEEVRNKKIYDLSLELYQRLQDQFILHTLRALEGKYDGITSNPEVSVSEIGRASCRERV